MQILGALCLLILELVMEYMCGAMITKALLKKDVNAGTMLLCGFMVYQVLFQVLALGIVCTTRVLHHLSVVWVIFLLIFVPLSCWYSRNTFKKQANAYMMVVKQNKGILLLYTLVVLAFVYYTCINGEVNEDSTYYIGLMTTSVETDSLFKYNAYTGMEMESFYLRRALATFEIQSAVMSQIFGIHPLVIARIFRAAQNVVLTSVAVLLCAKTLFWEKDENGVAKSMLCTVFFWILQLPFANTIYTSARFLLYRTYEAKAFAANFVVLFGIYLCVKLLRERNIGYVILIGIYLWGCSALATSAMLIAFVLCGIILVSILVWEKLYAR